MLLVCAGCRSPGSAASATVEATPAPKPARIDPNKFYAVLLNNGTVYYGKLDGYGTPLPTLREVFYIQRTMNDKSHAVSLVLIRRGRELHQPDEMILNPAAITFIEPVGDGSKIAGLIEQAQKP